MRLSGAGLAVVLLTGAAGVAQAQDAHRWLVRTRGLAIIPMESVQPSGARIHVEPGWAVEADISYSFSTLLSAELDLATSAHNLRSEASSDGSVHTFLPSLMVQVRPFSQKRFDPYIGAGGNVTSFYEVTGGIEVYDLSTSFGWVVQGGMDYRLGKGVVLNLDVKYASVSTEMQPDAGTGISLDVNPIIVGVGLGFWF